MTRNWDRVVVDLDVAQPEPTLLRSLAEGEVPVVVLRNLLPEQDFADNLARVREVFSSVSTTNYANGTLTTIGPYLNKYIDHFDSYFQAAKESDAMLGSVAFDLVGKVRDGLAEVFGLRSLERACEPDGREYAASVIRIHGDGVSNPLHNDNIMRDAAETDTLVAKLTYQLSCVVCLQECDEGGELVTYQKKWEPADESFKVRGGLGYDEAVVAGAAQHYFKPSARDVYLINPTFYHAIERVSGTDRLTMGFFLGFADKAFESAVVWG